MDQPNRRQGILRNVEALLAILTPPCMTDGPIVVPIAVTGMSKS